MKYIRTKEGIYELANERTITEFQVIDHLHNRAFLKDEILDQADTIKELCDGFYVQIDDWSFDTTHLFDNFEKAIEDFKDWQSYSDRKDLGYEIEVYAFIKTKKGLIYVAKMNNKEDLKLL